MSALAERQAYGTACPSCGAPLVADQDWCLECGAGVGIRILPAPDWRIPVAIVGAIVALTVVVLVLILSSLSDSANRSAAAAVAAAPATNAPPAAAAQAAPATATGSATTTTPAPATTTTLTGGIASWPSGVTGDTVVLGVTPRKAAATTTATKIAATGIPVGMLYSSDYSSMTPGEWIVFSGTYTSRAQADAAAVQLKAKGQPGAYAFPVVPAAH